ATAAAASSYATTDPRRWRLAVDEGRQTWHYIEDDADLGANWGEDPKPWDLYWQGLPFVRAPKPAAPSTNGAKTLEKATRPLDAAANGYRFFEQLQTPDGHWAGEYGGPMFLIPGLCIANYITGVAWGPGQRVELINYLRARANKVDGGWGIHIEGASTVFGTALNYVALRILGVDPDDPVCVKARATLHKLGGAVAAPAWGKFWLSVLNVYDWRGNNPIPPELWLWVHTRVVYMSMGYLYGIRFQAKIDPLIKALRKELYVQPYATIDWPAQRNNVAKVDLYAPHSKLMDLLNYLLTWYEWLPNSILRKPALDEALRQIRYEDINTNYLCSGPVNKAMNQIVVWLVDGPDSKSFMKHVDRNNDVLWKGPEGLMVNGTNGSQLWDTALAVQAIAESGLAEMPEFRSSLEKAMEFLDYTQIQDSTVIDRNICYRQECKGSWPFSTREQSYTVSDCTAEGLSATLLLQNELSFSRQVRRISDRRLFDAVDVMLSMQNADDGGFSSFELRRGPFWLEWLNPAEVFGRIMVEYSFPECTTSVVLALTRFKHHYPKYRAGEIK
ncbi:Lanosterol synthase (Oxidosqualene--lanosterol cyclase), partial [Cladochytrium tenue]